MLQFNIKQSDILRISLFLVKHNIEAEITDQIVTIKGDLTDDLLKGLQDLITAYSVKNYEDTSIRVDNTNKDESSEKANVPVKTEVRYELNPNLRSIIETPSSIIKSVFEKSKKVYYGGIYMCNFGQPYGTEEGYIRPVIVVQNKLGNIHSDSAIVIPCTTNLIRSDIATRLRLFFSEETTLDCDPYYMNKESVIMTEQIRVVDKKRLLSYIGVLKPKTMVRVQEKLRFALGIDVSYPVVSSKTYQENQIKEVNETKEINETVVETKKKPETSSPRYRQDINLEQIKMLQNVDIKELFNISKKYNSDEEKAKEILELFGFDLNKNGVSYLLKAIVKSPKNEYFNLETLVNLISKEDDELSSEKIKSLIISRIKETLGFKKSPSIDFIRLVNAFLCKEEE